jgi:hypothetical protein
MRRTSFITGILFIALLNYSCSNLKSSLSKSGSSDYSSRPSYSSASADRDSAAAGRSRTSYNTGDTGGSREKSDVSYKKDYLRTGSDTGLSPDRSPNTENSQQLISQYAEMDKLGDLVLYELDIVERRRDVLLDKYKSASNAERETLSSELNRLDSNQIALYKAYVKVYKEGRTDWPAVHKSVESTLLSLRGVGNK